MGCGSTRVDESKEKNETLSQDILAKQKLQKNYVLDF